MARLAVGVRLVAGLLAVAVLAGSGWGWYLGEVADASVNRTDAIPTSGNTGKGGAVNLLLVGNDSRVRLTDQQASELNTGKTPGLNTDTMILVHLPADGSKASFVSFPRDSYVEIPGYNWDKLNAAYAYGYEYEAAPGASEGARQSAGQQLLIRTISKLTGLRIDHYAEVDLLGFFELSNVIGGVEVNLCAPAQDSFSGVDLQAGKQTISGKQALAFVRQRHGLPRSDFDRIVRQQTFIAGMVRKMLSQNVLLDLGKQRQLVQAAATALTVDQNLDMLGLASQMQGVSPGNVNFQTVPYVGDDRDDKGRSIVRLKDEATLKQFFSELSADPEQEKPAAAPTTTAPATVAPAEVPVAVFNGSGVAGLAGSAAADLEAQGFSVVSTGNAASMDYATTEIRHAAGGEALAATLARAVPGATVQAADDVSEGTVQLIIGSDFNAIGQPVAAPEQASATSAPAATPEKARTADDLTCIN